MKARKQGTSRIVCALSEIAGGLTGVAVTAGKKIGVWAKESMATGQGPSDRGAGSPKRARPKTKKAVAVKKKKKATGQAKASKTTTVVTKAGHTVTSKVSSASGPPSSTAQTRTSKKS